MASAMWAPSSSAAIAEGAPVYNADSNSRITGVSWGVFTAEEIERLAKAHVTEHQLYAKNLPKLNGPNDPALGPSDRRVRCATCFNTMFKCINGHLGVIRLPVPLYHIGFIDDVFKILNSVCWSCSALLVSPNDPRVVHAEGPNTGQVPTTARFTAVTKIAKRAKCSACGVPQPVYSKEKLVIRRKWKKDVYLERIEALGGKSLLFDATRRFTPADALDIFRNIAPETVRALGMDPEVAHPASLILQNLPVLPPNARPTIMASEGSKRRGPADATNQMQDIVKACRQVRRAADAIVNPGKAKERKEARAAARAQRVAAAAKKKKAAGGDKTSSSAVYGMVGRQEDEPEDEAAVQEQEHALLVEHLLPEGGGDAVSGGPGRPFLTDDDVLALRFADVTNTDLYPSITPRQASYLWDAAPVYCERLQNEVAVYYDNSGRLADAARQRSGTHQHGLMQRLTGKTGQMRNNIVTKRADQTGRTVVAPDNQLDVDEVGVPDVMMNTLTVPEPVHAGNMELLTVAVRAGPGVAGGAARVLHATGHLTQLHLVKNRDAITLQPGDVVERHLVDGDPVCFNRQPSLHRLSFVAMRARRVPGQAFRLSLAAASQFNADFDGDEMNLHVMQSAYANAELLQLMAVGKNVINPQNNAPALAIVQDTMVGSMLLTARDTLLGPDIMHQCVGAIRYRLPGKTEMPQPAFWREVPAVQSRQAGQGARFPGMARVYGSGGGSGSGTTATKLEPAWTGKQLFSLLLPPITLEKWVRGAAADDRKVDASDPDERYVRIVNGVLECGKLCKGTLGGAPGSILHKICTDHGEAAAVRFLSDLQRVIYAWLPSRGLTFSLRDCIVSPETRRKVDTYHRVMDVAVERIVAEAERLRPHLTEAEAVGVESNITTALNEVQGYTSRIVVNEHRWGVPDSSSSSSLRPPPPPPHGWAMVEAGSKGSAVNISQVAAQVGQINVDGGRIAPAKGSRRTLTMFPPGAHSASARGFVTTPFILGNEPHGYFFHMMGGREGVITTATVTADTGYGYRSAAKAMENNVVCWDLSVRNIGQNYIIQFIVGGDGMDPTKVERVNVGALKMSEAALRDALTAPGVPSTYVDRVVKLRTYLLRHRLNDLASVFSTMVLLPVNVRDEVQRHAVDDDDDETGANANADDGDGDNTAATNAAFCAQVQQLIDDLRKWLPHPLAMAELEFVLLYECRPQALRRVGLTPFTFRDSVAQEVKHRFVYALAHPGDCVGVVAAQSIGEPATQFTLNVFHTAGMVQRLLTVGVPRLKELLNASKAIRTPAILAPYRDTGASKEVQDGLAASLQFLCVDAVIHSSYPQLEPVGEVATSKDAALLEFTTALYGPEPATASPWVLRLVLNAAVLRAHGMTPRGVAARVAVQMKDYKLAMVYSQPNMQTWVLRLRLVGDDSEQGCRKLHADLRESVLLGGISGVRHCRVISRARYVDTPDRGVVSVQERVMDIECVPVASNNKPRMTLQKLATQDWLDWERTTTNDVQEVVQTLGLLAGRRVLLTELERVIGYGGKYVDPRHLTQVVDSMTHRGFVMPFTRHGINRVDFSTMQRASFEEPVDQVLQAARGGVVQSSLQGRTDCIVFGQKAPLGTGLVALRHDVPVQSTGAFRPMVSSAELKEYGAARSRAPIRPAAQNVRINPKLVPKLRAVRDSASVAHVWEGDAPNDLDDDVEDDQGGGSGGRLYRHPVLEALFAPVAAAATITTDASGLEIPEGPVGALPPSISVLHDATGFRPSSPTPEVIAALMEDL